METNIYVRFCAEIDRDYSILNSQARDRLKVMLILLAEDAYNRGKHSINNPVVYIDI